MKASIQLSLLNEPQQKVLYIIHTYILFYNNGNNIFSVRKTQRTPCDLVKLIKLVQEGEIDWII